MILLCFWGLIVCVFFQVVDESVPRARVLSEDWAALLDAMLLVPFLVP